MSPSGRGIRPLAALAGAILAIAGCAGTTPSHGTAQSAAGAPAGAPAAGQPAAALAQWSALVHTARPLDLAGPRADGSLVLAAAGRLALLHRHGTLSAFAPAYSSPGGEEPYIALTPAHSGGACPFPPGTVYALRLQAGRGVVAIGAGGIRPLARLTAPGLIDGITFDQTGRFEHRLLVTISAGRRTTVDAIDCRGAVTTITTRAHRVEGGIAVAPAGFGRFAGDLIAPDEKGGGIFAITPGGRSLMVAASGLPFGQDIGVESEGFMPVGSVQAVMADRVTPGGRHPGDDVVLRLSHAALAAAGVRPGDLLVASEGGARTDAIRCTRRACRVRHIADGPAIAHGEGHIAFLAPQ